MGDRPTTGDPRLDAVVTQQFTEAIELCRIIIKDCIPGATDEEVDRAAAQIPVHVFHPLAQVVLMGFGKLKEAEDAYYQDTAAQGRSGSQVPSADGGRDSQQPDRGHPAHH